MEPGILFYLYNASAVAIHAIHYIRNVIQKISTENLNGVQAEGIKGLE